MMGHGGNWRFRALYPKDYDVNEASTSFRVPILEWNVEDPSSKVYDWMGPK
jgi:hypothetical protein